MTDQITLDTYYEQRPTGDEIQADLTFARQHGVVTRWQRLRDGQGQWLVRVHYRPTLQRR